MAERVLQVIPSLELGGTEAYVINNYRYIDKEKTQFDFFVFTEKSFPYANEIKNLGGNVYYGVQPSFKNLFKFLKILKNVCKKNKYRAIHCHANASNALPIFCAAACGIKKRISHCHAICGGSRKFANKIKFLMHKMVINLFANEYLACSKTAGISLYGKNLFIKKGKVLKNAIDVDKFLCVDKEMVNNLRNELHIEKNKIVLGNISRFDNNKNQIFALEVFSELVKTKPESILVLGGVDGGMLQATKNKVKELNLQGKVLFIGPRDDVPNCLQLIDIYLFPSLSEGFGISLLEAQAAGCMCFASTGVPNKTDMGLGLTQYYALELGAQKWAENISIYLENLPKLKEESIKKAFIDKGFSIKENVRQIEGVYYKE